MHPEVVLRQADVAEFVFGAPGSGERGLFLVDGRVKASKPLVELFFLLIESQVSVNDNRHQKPTARWRSWHRDPIPAADTNSLPAIFSWTAF